MVPSKTRSVHPIRRFIGACYCSALWSMALALLVSRWTWLEMRFNVGWTFFGLWVLFCTICFFAQAIRPGWRLAVGSLAASVLAGILACGGVQGLLILPACLIREGLAHGAWQLDAVNGGMAAFVVIGFAAVVAADVRSAPENARKVT